MSGTPNAPVDPTTIMSRTDFARQLTQLKDLAGLSVRQVARASGLPVGTLGDYFGGRHLPPLNPARLPLILRACGVHDEDVIRAWVEALRRVRRGPSTLPGSAPPPYRGLASFQPEDAEWFHGREELTEQLIAAFLAGDGAIAVVGPSGSGKSSLLRAGLIPALRDRGLVTVLLTPGDSPLDDLALALAGDPDALVIDQFEELFTGKASEAVRREFIDVLLRPSTVRIAIGIRADFYAQALRYEALAALLETAQIIVRPMTQDELRQAIVGPARRAELILEDGLVEMLLHDAAPAAGVHEIGSLPLLSHALLAMWERSRRGRLTIAVYLDIGAISGSVAKAAESVYAGLDKDQQRIARQVFVRLVNVAEATGDTRRRVVRTELDLGEGTAAVVDRFVDRRLITATADSIELTHEALLVAWPTLRSWLDADRAGLRIHRRLTMAVRTWLDTDRDRQALLRGMGLDEVTAWARDPRHADDLTSVERDFLDACLADREAEAATARRRRRLAKAAVATVAAASLIIASLVAVAVSQKRQADDQRDEAISRRTALMAGKLRATDPALAAELSMVSYQISPNVETRSVLAEAFAQPAVTRFVGHKGTLQTVAVSADQRTMATAGLDRTIRLWDITKPASSSRSLTGMPGTVFSVAFNPAGTMLASGGSAGSLLLWDLTKALPQAVKLHGPGNTVYSVVFSPDGRTLAAASADKTVRLWTISSGVPVPLEKPLTGFSDYVQAVAFAPDGRTLAAGSADGSVRLWDVSSPRRPVRSGPALTGPTKTVFAVAFAADSRTLAVGSGDHTVRLWNLASRGHPVPAGPPLTGPRAWVNSVAFSPDGHRVAAASSDGLVWSWDPVTRKPAASLAHPGPVTSVVFLGRDKILTSAADGVARQWETAAPVVDGPAGGSYSLTASADGRVMAVAGADGIAHLWTLDDFRRPVALSPIRNAIRQGTASGASALSPDGRFLVVGSREGASQLWDLTTPTKPIPLRTRLTGPTSVVQGITFSPDGRLLAIADNDTTVRLWDMTDPEHPVAVANLTGATNYAYQPAFSPDGRFLAYGSADTNVHLWNITDPRHPSRLGGPLIGHQNYVLTVAFSPDGRFLASGGSDDTVILWSLDDGPPERTATLSGPTNYIYSLAFDSADPRLAAVAGDGTVWVWDVGRPRTPSLFSTWTASPHGLFADAFMGRRPILATAGDGSPVRLWNIDPDEVTASLCLNIGTPITRDEWRRYLPDRPYRPPCSR